MTDHPKDSRRPSNQTPFDATVNVNSASQEQLRALPGIGDAHARAIVEFRERHGSITHLEMLRDMEVLPAGLFDEIRPMLKV